MAIRSTIVLAFVSAWGTTGVLWSATANEAASTPVDNASSPMRPYIERFTRDQRDLERFYDIPIAADSHARMQSYYEKWRQTLAGIDFDSLPQDGKVDYLLLRNYLDHELKQLQLAEKWQAESAAFVPFATAVIGLEEARRSGQPVVGSASAATLAHITEVVQSTQKAVEAGLKEKTESALERQRQVAANRAANETDELRNALRRWYGFYDNYDPLFTWWAAESYQKTDAALTAYESFLREKVVGIQPTAKAGEAAHPHPGAKPGSTDDIVGSPLGRQALRDELEYEMIPYTPEELIALARKQYAWCETEMKRASREMGFGDDWKKALEKVKTMYVQPGQQPDTIRMLQREAEEFVNAHDLVTIPPIASETWRMDMMSPERQLVNPFFTGGETISVSYPVADMTYEQKMMTMRGNNIPFSRATVFHELIPGHELQGYMASRYKFYRMAVSDTPFLVEGWSLYWELLFWDMKFQKTPEDRVGALFWRMHRCARIIFSLSFHLGNMTPQECVDFLVDRVGFERENAIGEVRRSFAGGYTPLYQAAYLVGGLQLFALRKELVDSGKMTNRQFHDAILRENEIPIALIRASLTNQKLTRDFVSDWRF